MQRPSRSTVLICVAALVIAALIGVVVTSNGGSNAPHPPNGVTDKQAKLAVGGDTSVVAEIISPKGRHHLPLVVLPTSWGSSTQEYRTFGYQLADDGFQVVAYAQPGFAGSTGTIDYAGTATQRVASRVIDWALAHTKADPKRIGMLGVSYGAGVSLLAAARDARIKAVVAMSTWTDLAACFHANDTTSVTALGGLLASAAKTGNLSGDWTHVASSLRTNPAAAGTQVEHLAKARSPISVVDALNRNRPAIMIANAFEDSIIPPLQLVSFYNRLTGPKRLQLAPGDHGGPEYPGLHGQPDTTTASALAWLRHYLGGADNHIEQQLPVRLQDIATRSWHAYRSWPSNATTLQLGRPGSGSGFSVGATHSWTAGITAGTDTIATSGPGQILSGQAYEPPTITLGKVAAKHAFAWLGPAVAKPSVLSGTPHLRLNVRASTGAASLFTYLYDVGATGRATLLSVTPYTSTRARTASTISFELQPTSWTFAAGHRLGMVIDTVDSRWHSASAAGSRVTLSSSTAHPASLTLPLKT